MRRDLLFCLLLNFLWNSNFWFYWGSSESTLEVLQESVFCAGPLQPHRLSRAAAGLRCFRKGACMCLWGNPPHLNSPHTHTHTWHNKRLLITQKHTEQHTLTHEVPALKKHVGTDQAHLALNRNKHWHGRGDIQDWSAHSIVCKPPTLQQHFTKSVCFWEGYSTHSPTSLTH